MSESPVIPDGELIVEYMVDYDLDPSDTISDLLAAIRMKYKEGRGDDDQTSNHQVHERQDLQDSKGTGEALRPD